MIKWTINDNGREDKLIIGFFFLFRVRIFFFYIIIFIATPVMFIFLQAAKQSIYVNYISLFMVVNKVIPRLISL